MDEANSYFNINITVLFEYSRKYYGSLSDIK